MDAKEESSGLIKYLSQDNKVSSKHKRQRSQEVLSLEKLKLKKDLHVFGDYCKLINPADLKLIKEIPKRNLQKASFKWIKKWKIKETRMDTPESKKSLRIIESYRRNIEQRWNKEQVNVVS